MIGDTSSGMFLTLSGQIFYMGLTAVEAAESTTRFCYHFLSFKDHHGRNIIRGRERKQLKRRMSQVRRGIL